MIPFMAATDDSDGGRDPLATPLALRLAAGDRQGSDSVGGSGCGPGRRFASFAVVYAAIHMIRIEAGFIRINRPGFGLLD